MMLIVGMIVVVGLPVMALCQEEVTEVTTVEEEAAVVTEAAEDTGPPFLEEIYAAIDTVEASIVAEEAAREAADTALEADLEAEIAVADAALEAILQAEIDTTEAALQADIDATEVILQEQIDTVVASAPIPITQADIPLTISTPGSYYLTEDVTSSGTAINVAVDDVTIDLAGYAVVGTDSALLYHGIYMNGRSNVEIRNGTVRDFYNGIYAYGVTSGNHRIINVRVVSNVTGGIVLDGTGHLVKDCTISENGDSAFSHVYGIRTGTGSTVTGNTISYNGNSASHSVHGIHAYNGSTVTGNTVSNNGSSADGDVRGILANGSTVTGNTVFKNAHSAEGNVYGIATTWGGALIENTVYDNGDYGKGSYVYGIRVGSGVTVTGNSSYSNGTAADGTVYGIYLVGYSLVDQNTAISNGGGAASAVNMNTSISTCVYGINLAP